MELSNEDAVLIDARNSYEVEVGRMDDVKAKIVGQGARRFRDQVEQVLTDLQRDGDANKRILMFCTSGIRCEKLAAVLENRGFNNVAQLNGGVTGYVRQARQERVLVKFKLRVVVGCFAFCFGFV
jgi:UPF0176 protein